MIFPSLNAHLFLCLLANSIGLVLGNNMDPHVYPSVGPFFEGWYLRVIDAQQNTSFGFLFGLVLPAATENSTHKMHHSSPTTKENPLVCASLLLNPPSADKLGSPTACFDPSDYSVLKDGKPVTQDPDDETPPNFEAKISNNLSYIVTPNGSHFSVSIGDHVLKGETTAPVPWGPRGEGPESWLEYLPLPIHWFVYSFRSTVVTYMYKNTDTGEIIKGASTKSDPPVVAHMEKNWGKSFIKAWVWAEGVDPVTDIYFSLTSGIIEELGLSIPAQLSGYRNPKKGIDCSFHPANSEHKLVHDGCMGTTTLEVQSLECHVVFRLYAAPASFSSCLVTPQVEGFRLGCLESYAAVANITAHLTLSGVTDNQMISLSGLEFGGSFMCKGKCP